MAYTKKVWKDAPDTSTPINAANLNHMEDGIAEADVNAQNALDRLDDVDGEIIQINSGLTDRYIKKPKWNKKNILGTSYTPTEDCYVSVFARGSDNLYCEVAINGNVMLSEYLNGTTTQYFYIPSGITIAYTLGGGTVFQSNFVVSDTL